MDTSALAISYSAELPAWVHDELADVPEFLETDEDRMALVHRLADRNFREKTGGPFAALVVETETGRIVSAGVNLVLASNLSAAHAEVVALSLAQTRVGTWDLGAEGAPARELVVNWRPCAQCYGATLWSGVKRAVIAGDGPELEELTHFDEGPVRDDWQAQLEQRGLEIELNVLRDEAIEVFRAYGESIASGDSLVYNARGTAENG